MNSWLGGGLSSLKGQLSHLITEGTEEISDPNLEINNAKSKILELENQLLSDANEIMVLKERNTDLEMKLQSEELLLQNVSESYQEKLKEKEEIINSLTSKLSTISHQISEKETHNRLSTSDDGFVNECFYDDDLKYSNKHHSSNSDSSYVHRTIEKLNQEILKWKSLFERSQQPNDQISPSFDSSMHRLLEDQQRDLELQHSNYILELQQEHSKQIAFLNHKLHLLEQSINDDDRIHGDTRRSDITSQTEDNVTQEKETTLIDAWTETVGANTGENWWNESVLDLVNEGAQQYFHVIDRFQLRSLVTSVVNKIGTKEDTFDTLMRRITEDYPLSPTYRPRDHNGLFDAADQQISLSRIASQLKSALADSVSQVSDLSEVSNKSRILDEHVRLLTDQIRLYEKQIADIGGTPDDAIDRMAQVKIINDKIELLKVKLIQRKHVGEQADLPECSNEDRIEESWENSSVNSLVEEHVVPCKLDLDQLEQDIGALYRLVQCDMALEDLDIGSMMRSIIDQMPAMVDAANRAGKLESQLMDLYGQEMTNGDCDGRMDSLSIMSMLGDSLRTMKETCSVHEYIIQENKSLQELVSQLRASITNVEREKEELVEKNSQLDEQLMDLSITMARYDGLEKICDQYQQQMSAAGVNDSSEILEHVETFNEEKDERIESLEAHIVQLQNEVEDKDDNIEALKKREIEVVYEYDALVTVLKGELESAKMEGDEWRELEHSYKQQIEQLNARLKEFEEMTVVASKTHVDNANVAEERVAHIQEEPKLDILDNNGPNEDSIDTSVARETVHRLSQLVRDREIEIEALKAKNESLCSIVKNCDSNEAADDRYKEKIEALQADRDRLTGELNWYRENRDELIATLTVKHQESVNYHGELQRLIAHIDAEQTRWTELAKENERLKQQQSNPAVKLVDVGVSCNGGSNDGASVDQVEMWRARCIQLEQELHSALDRGEETRLQMIAEAAGPTADTDGLQKQADYSELSGQIDQLRARESKLVKEKQILQDHLIKIEESYTQDAFLAEDREQTLRKQLHRTEDGLHEANIEIGELKQIIANIRRDMQIELDSTIAERDKALHQIIQTEAQLMEQAQSLSNLQSVLDRFQQDQAAEMLYQKERLQQELVRITTDRDQLQARCRQLQVDIDDQRELVDAAQRLTQQMERKDDQLAEIQALLAKKEEQIDGLKMEIRKLNTFTESKVDKILMKNLIIGYFHTPQHRRPEALKVIGSLLQFSDADYSQIGIDTANRSRWFSWLRAGTDKSNASATVDSDLSGGKSFSELFISFLEQESNPVPRVKLPISHIAVEARQHSSLSQSDEYPYTPTAHMLPIVDHHQFFTPSPLVTKRNGSPTSEELQSTNYEQRNTPLLYIPSINDISSGITRKDDRTLPNHRRSESGRNALLSLLDQ